MDTKIPKTILDKFASWYEEAKESVKDPSAMTLATATKSGIPSARIVLLKKYDENGFIFYTNNKSRKAKEIKENPSAALVCYWDHHQVRIEGRIEEIGEHQSDEYFNSRSFEKKIVSTLSKQSSVLENPDEFQEKIKQLINSQQKDDLKRPDHWSGFRVIPATIEFWTNGDHRNHERIIHKLTDNVWVKYFLYP